MSCPPRQNNRKAADFIGVYSTANARVVLCLGTSGYAQNQEPRRFNVWGELAAIVLGLPLSILVWFVLDFQSKPMWQGLGLLFALSFVVLVAVTLMTPAESEETLKRFYARCRPPGFWGPISIKVQLPDNGEPTGRSMLIDSGLGIFASLCLVLATNAIFVRDWVRFTLAIVGCAASAAWLLHRMWHSAKSRKTDALNTEMITK